MSYNVFNERKTWFMTGQGGYATIDKEEGVCLSPGPWGPIIINPESKKIPVKFFRGRDRFQNR